jgi:hypothetical protein
MVVAGKLYTVPDPPPVAVRPNAEDGEPDLIGPGNEAEGPPAPTTIG